MLHGLYYPVTYVCIKFPRMVIHIHYINYHVCIIIMHVTWVSEGLPRGSSVVASGPLWWIEKVSLSVLILVSTGVLWLICTLSGCTTPYLGVCWFIYIPSGCAIHSMFLPKAPDNKTTLLTELFWRPNKVLRGLPNVRMGNCHAIISSTS